MFDDISFGNPVVPQKFLDTEEAGAAAEESLLEASSNQVQPNSEDVMEKDLMSLETSSVESSTMEVSGEEFSMNPQDYKLEEPIGYGSSAVVHFARYLPTNAQVAIKIIDLDRFERGQIDTLRKEIQVMSLCRNENLLRVLASFVRDSQLWIVTPFCDAGSCLDLLRTPENRSGIMNEAAIATILWQALQGLTYLHANGHIHRDIKAGNLLVDMDGTVHLADFGVSSSLLEGNNSNRAIRKTFVGTPCWMAPEVMEMTRGYDSKADIWSFGITAYELANGHAPYAKLPAMKVIFVTLSNEAPKLNRHRSQITFSKAFKDLIGQCLQKDPSKRPTSETLMKHPFFKQARRKDYLATELLAGLEPIQQRAKVNVAKMSSSRSRPVETIPEEPDCPEAESWDFSSDGETGSASAATVVPSSCPGIDKRGRFVVEPGLSHPSSPQAEESHESNVDSLTVTANGMAEIRKGRFSVNASEPLQLDSITSTIALASPQMEAEEEGKKSRFEVVHPNAPPAPPPSVPAQAISFTNPPVNSNPNPTQEVYRPAPQHIPRTASVMQERSALLDFPIGSPLFYGANSSCVSCLPSNQSQAGHHIHHHHTTTNATMMHHHLPHGHMIQWQQAQIDQLLHMNELMRLQLLDLRVRLHDSTLIGMSSPPFPQTGTPSGLPSPTASQTDLRPNTIISMTEDLERQLNQLRLENDQLRRRYS